MANCNYPQCKCPFDMGADNKCLRGCNVNKLDGNAYLTHWEGEMGEEYDVRVGFDYQPAEKPDYEDGHMVYPGCEEGVAITQVDRMEQVALDVNEWVDEWNGATVKEEGEWCTEILELIHKAQMEAYDE